MNKFLSDVIEETLSEKRFSKNEKVFIRKSMIIAYGIGFAEAMRLFEKTVHRGL